MNYTLFLICFCLLFTSCVKEKSTDLTRLDNLEQIPPDEKFSKPNEEEDSIPIVEEWPTPVPTINKDPTPIPTINKDPTPIPTINGEPTPQPTISTTTLDINRPLLNMSNEVVTKDLANITVPTVLLLGTLTCGACVWEHQAIANDIVDIQVTFQKVNFYTFLLDADVENVMDKQDIIAWRDNYNVSWEIGTDNNYKLYQKYCPGNYIPCVVIYIPSVGIVYKHSGSVPVSTIKQHTKEWN